MMTGSRHPYRTRRKAVFAGALTACLCGLLLITACEQPFEPVQENVRHFFSINGYLDASVDTQWVRVMPVRGELAIEPGLPVPTVTLEHIESGATVQMRDSVFTFTGGRYAYNFWTTMPVEPEQSYRITAEGTDGRSSHAETTLPEEYPLPYFDEPEFGADILIIKGVKRLADVQVVYRIRRNSTRREFEASFPYLEFGIFLLPETYRVDINPDYGRSRIIDTYCGVRVIERNVFVAAGGPGWVDFVSLDRYTIALPDGVGNVENGVGYFGGIISKTFPYVSAEGDSGLFQVPCPGG